MPEYSSTTITPADGVQVPSMNGSTSGNFLLSALKSYILAEKGQANGLASLGSDGKLTAAQLPDLADDVIVVASYAVLPAAGTAGKIYITADNNKMFRWDPDLTTPDYVELSVDLSAYATKAELAAEESARESEDSNLKSAIDANSKRITNLETKAGDEIPVTYPSATYGMDGVPASVAPYGKVRELILNSRMHNQLVQSGMHNWNANNGIIPSFDYDTKTVSLTGTSTASFNAIMIDAYQCLTVGHTYVVGLSQNAVGFELRDAYNGLSNLHGSYVFTATSIFFNLRGVGNSGVTPNYSSTVSLVDLTQYFDGTIPSNASTIAEIQQNYPELLIPSDYDTGTRVDTTYSAVESEGRNLAESVFVNSDSTQYVTVLRAEFDIKPNTQYTLSFVGANGSVVYVNDGIDTSYHQISCNGTRQSVTFTTKAYIAPTQRTSDGWSLLKNHPTTSVSASFTDVQIEVGSSATAYSPYFKSTLTLPTPVTGKSAGSVHQIYYPETGEMTEPLVDIDLSQISFSSLSGVYYANLSSYGFKVHGELMCAKYFNSDKAYTELGEGEISSNNAGFGNAPYIFVKDSNGTPTGTVTCELASPNPNSQATVPVNDPFIKVEGGGTIRPVQTQTTQIDSAMSVDYLGV